MDVRSSRDLILSLDEARMLRDEIAKLLADKVEQQRNFSSKSSNEVIQVEIMGGKW
jgi:hypothetical protein